MDSDHERTPTIKRDRHIGSHASRNLRDVFPYSTLQGISRLVVDDIDDDDIDDDDDTKYNSVHFFLPFFFSCLKAFFKSFVPSWQ